MNSTKRYSPQKMEWKQALRLVIYLSILSPSLSLAQNDVPYYEDLSKWRPVLETKKKDRDSIDKIKLYVTPKKTINTKVDAILDSIDRYNLAQNIFDDGYTIQIYSGQKREEAINIKRRLQEEMPDLIGNLTYQQPKFRVTVGKYFTRLETQPDLLRLKKKFSMAILVPEKISIK